jgi:hypothetical protein
VKAWNSCSSARGSVLALLCALGAPACGPQPFAAAEIDVIATRLGAGSDFGGLVTFAMPRDVVDLCDELAEIPPGGVAGAGGLGGGSSIDDYETCRPPDHSQDAAILEQVRFQLEALGYQEVESDADPDFAVVIGLVAQTELRVWEGVPWCDAHELFTGCWKPDYEYPYRVPLGALMVDFVLPEPSMDQREFVSTWTAVLAGLGLPDAADEDRVTTAIATAFEQSPYLAEGGAP